MSNNSERRYSDQEPSWFGKNWLLIVIVLVVGTAVFLYFNGYGQETEAATVEEATATAG